MRGCVRVRVRVRHPRTPGAQPSWQGGGVVLVLGADYRGTRTGEGSGAARDAGAGRGQRCRLAMAPGDAGAGSPAVAGLWGGAAGRGGCAGRGQRASEASGGLGLNTARWAGQTSMQATRSSDQANHGCPQLVKEPIYLTKSKRIYQPARQAPRQANQVSEARHTAIEREEETY